MSGLPVEPELVRWIEKLPPAMIERLAAADVVDARQVAAIRPLTDLIGEWRAHLAARELDERHIKSTTTCATRLFAACKMRVLVDIERTPVEEFLSNLRAKGKSARTGNSYLQAARQFVRWAIKSGLSYRDPLVGIDGFAKESDRRRLRRALTAQEAQRLVAAAAAGPEVEGSSGALRALVYRIALETGLRKNEIATLLVSDLDLTDTARSAICPRACNTKNAKAAHLPIRAALAEALRSQVKGRLPRARVFDLPTTWASAAWIKADLAAAGIEYKDGAGRYADFHALRVTFCTMLGRAGVSLQTAQKMMRHASPALTANVYTVLGRDDFIEALSGLPDLGVETAAAQKTGTDDLQLNLPDATPMDGTSGHATAHGTDDAQARRAGEIGQPDSAERLKTVRLAGELAVGLTPARHSEHSAVAWRAAARTRSPLT